MHTVTPNAVIPDNAYDGILASMACADLDFSSSHDIQSVIDVTLDLGIDQTWIGDLTVKVVNPGGSVLTVLSRPGFFEPADDGSGCCGDSSDMSSAFPLSFADVFTDPAETMGDTILDGGVVCQDDGRCSYAPSPGAGPGTSFAQFDEQSGVGTWQVCVGDSAAGDPGIFASATLSIQGEWIACRTSCAIDFGAVVNTTSLPSSGGRLVFSVQAVNTSATPEQMDLWVEAEGPTSLRRLLATGTIPAGATVTRDVRLNVPAAAPDGTYDVLLVLGDYDDPFCPCDAENFTITKGAAPFTSAGDALLLKATVVAEDFFAAEAAPASAAVQPNPFRDRTTLRFALAAPADVRLAVYDLLGREVAVLVDGPTEAGAHAATSDARGLAAGTYVYRLTVGGAVQAGRLTLTR